MGAGLKSIRVVEVGPRDGLQNEPTLKQLPLDQLVDLRVRFITMLARSGLTDVEAGAFVRADRVPELDGGGADAAGRTAFPDDWTSRHGKTTRAPDGKFTLCVPGENIGAVSAEILAAGPVADITIEDVPLEDIIAELFQSR